MQNRQGASSPRRRRWRRERVGFTVLGRFAGGDRLGKAVNLSDRGLGAVFQGRGYTADQAVELQLVAGCTVCRSFGVVRSATPRGGHTRLGIRTFGFVPADVAATGSWGAAGTKTGRRNRPVAVPDPAPCGLGAGFSPVSPGGVRAMERDRKELARDLRARYGLAPKEPWDQVLRRFLAHLPHSPLRSRFLREQFRSSMDTAYPAPGGTVISGSLVPGESPVEAVGGVPPCVIHLDHFAVACSDHYGQFVAKGIPPQDDAVSVSLRVANHAVLSTAPVAVYLPRLGTVEIEVEIPIVLRAAPAARSLRPVSLEEDDLDLEGFRQLVDQF